MHQSIQINLAVAGTKYNLRTLFEAAIGAVKAAANIFDSVTPVTGYQLDIVADNGNAGKVKVGGKNMDGNNYATCTVFEAELLAGDSKAYGSALVNSIYLGDYQFVADTNNQKLTVSLESR